MIKSRAMWVGLLLTVCAQERIAKLRSMEENSDGLAAEYPGDKGLERDGHVLFAENFESGSIGEIGKRWGNIHDPQNMDLSADVSRDSAGKRSLHIVGGVAKGEDGAATGRFRDGGHLYTHFKGA